MGEQQISYNISIHEKNGGNFWFISPVLYKPIFSIRTTWENENILIQVTVITLKIGSVFFTGHFAIKHLVTNIYLNNFLFTLYSYFLKHLI